MLHGRSRECALIDELLAAAGGGRSGVLVLKGEAGIGKSALLGYAAGHATGMRILRGAGVESESEFPFAAVHQLLRPVLPLLDAIPERLGAALRGAFGAGPAVAQDRFLISLAVLSLLAEAAEEGPLLCLIDDAHWLDGASAGALTFAARRLDCEGVVLLFATRDRLAGLPDLPLTGIDAAAAGALLAERSGVTLPDRVRDDLVASTAGNPLALLELPGALSAAQLSGRADLPGRLPVGAEVEQVFLERVRREEPGTQTLLLVAAAEETGDLGTVLRAAEVLAVPAGALDAAERAGLIRVDGGGPGGGLGGGLGGGRAGVSRGGVSRGGGFDGDRVGGGRVEFCHPLVRAAVYRGATFWQRRDAEQALASVLDDTANADRRAWHLAAAALGPDETVAAEMARSAERAAARGGHAAAATAWERAATLTADPDRRGERLTDAARAAWQAGSADRATALLDRAAPLLAAGTARARADHLRGTIEAAAGEPITAYAILTAAAEPLAATDPVRAAGILTEAGQAAWLAGDVAGMHRAGRRLTALPMPDDAVPLSAELVVGLHRLLSGDTADAVAHLRDAAGRAARSDDLRAITLGAAGAMFLGDDATAAGLFTAAVARARSAGAAGMLVALLAPLSSLEAWTGRFAAASANAAEGLRIAEETGQDNPAAHLRSVLAWIAAVHGRDEECRAYAEAAHAHAIARRLGPAAGIASWSLALLDLSAGRPEQACDRLATLSVAGPGDSHPIVGIFSAADLVEAAARTGREDVARTALGRLAAWASATGSVWGEALVSRCCGLLAEGAAADRHFTEALSRHPRAGRPFDKGRTELLFGEALRRRRKRAEARIHLRAAHETFERLGLPVWAAQAGTELRATGETARKREPGAITQLTPQETQIVRIIGGGATNREVAAQLFLSPRTIDYHVRKIFTKLDVSSRADLIRLAAREDR